MTVLTVTAKGQVTLRKDILEHLGVRPGDKVAVDMLPGRRIAVQADRRTGNIADAFGILKRKGQPVLTIEEINEAIERGWAGEE
ncbi:MAG: AbrB/MazE/SpoVT family DNA-binding domain-containing protein [Sphingomonas sp.]